MERAVTRVKLQLMCTCLQIFINLRDFIFNFLGEIWSITEFTEYEVTLLQEVSNEPRIVDKSTWWIAIFCATSSKTLFSNFFSALCKNFSYPFKSSLNFWTTSANWAKIGWEVSTSMLSASTRILFASSRTWNSPFLSSLSLFYLAFFYSSSPTICIWLGFRLEISQFEITISSLRSMSSSLSLPLLKTFVLGWGLLSIILVLIIYLIIIETMV